MCKVEITWETSKLLMEWCKMGKFNLDPKMLGNLLIQLVLIMICKLMESNLRAWCSSHAVIKPKIWYLDLLLKLRSQDLQSLKAMVDHKPLEVVKDLLVLRQTLKPSFMQSMEEAWASKEMDKQSITTVKQPTPRAFSPKFSKINTIDKTLSIINKTMPITWTRPMEAVLDSKTEEMVT